MKCDTKPLLHIIYDGVADVYYIMPFCPAVVDEYQSLMGMYSCRTERTAFPATLLYHPSKQLITDVDLRDTDASQIVDLLHGCGQIFEISFKSVVHYRFSIIIEYFYDLIADLG